MTETNVNFSSRILLRLILLGAIVLVLLIANFNFFNELYFTRQLTMAGYVINGSIFVVFVLGLVKIILSLLRYMREEAAIARKYTGRVPWEMVAWGLGNFAFWLSLWPLTFSGVLPLWVAFLLSSCVAVGLPPLGSYLAWHAGLVQGLAGGGTPSVLAALLWGAVWWAL